MFRNIIDGLSTVIHTDIPRGMCILITGGPGTMKSTLLFNILSNYLHEQEEEFGLYISLEEPRPSLERNIKSIGLKTPNNLKLFDYQDIRREYGYDKEIELEIMSGIEEMIKYYKEHSGKNFTCIGLDSLNAMYSLMTLTNLRSKIYHLFDTFKMYNLTSFIILEKVDGKPDVYGGEYFLADGVINMGTMKTKDDITIYLQIEKMRATKHSRKKYQVSIGKNGLSIIGPEYE